MRPSHRSIFSTSIFPALVVSLCCLWGASSPTNIYADDTAPTVKTETVKTETVKTTSVKTASVKTDIAPKKTTEVKKTTEAKDDEEKSADKKNGLEQKIDDAFGAFNGVVASALFYPIPVYPGHTVPLTVLWLVLGSIFFTVYMGFINVRGFKHAILVTAGKFDKPDHEKEAGEVSHFQALTAALSATVGLGNIAGVAVAISLGGPGATLWMIAAGFLGMSTKFVECSLGQKFREVRPDGRVMGGAMYYLSRGLEQIGLKSLGKVLAVIFAILCVGGSFAGGNAFQVNQSLSAISEISPFLKENGWVYGLIMTIFVGIVIIGGIRRIATITEKVVPAMCGIYLLAALAILFMNFSEIPTAFSAIIQGAFNPKALYGGAIGVLIVGFKRAAFSNEAGVGSAAIAHAAAKTDYPVREGAVALLGPFIDTIVVCTMTALVIVITGAYSNPDYESLRKAKEGAALTSRAMDGAIPGFRYLLAVSVVLFAYSTLISWSYYGERCWAYLFGDRASLSYRILFLVFTFLGSIVSATNVLEFGDLMILGMAFPNILGVVLLSGMVKKDLKVYWKKLKNGEFPQKK